MAYSFKNDPEDEKFLEIGVFASKAIYYYYMWPKKVTLRYKLGVIIYMLCIFFIIYGSVWHLIHYTRLNGVAFGVIADDIAAVMTCSTFFYILVGFMPIRNNVEHVCKIMGNFMYYKKPKNIVIMNSRMDRVGKYVLFYIWFCLLGIIFIKFMQKCEPDDYTDCGLLIPSYLPIDIYSSTNRKIYMILQVVSVKFIACISHLIGWVLLVMVECIICYVRELISMVKEIPNVENRLERRLHVNKCIEYHQHILNFTGEFCRSISHLACVHLYMTPLVMSVIAFQLMALEFDIKNVIHLQVWFLVTTAACVISERLIHVSELLHSTIFYSIPFDDDVQLSKDLMFMMMRSEQVLSISGMGLGLLGHEHLMNIITTAYSYLSVLANTL